MNIKLFDDLYSHITKESTEDTFTEEKIVDIFTKEEFLFYIIGSYSTNCNHIDYSKLSPEMTCKLLKGSVTLYSIFADEYFYILEKSKRLRLGELLYTHLRNTPSKAQTVRKNVENQDQISKLYKKYNISIPTDENTEKLLINLFTICITEDIKIFSSYINQLLKPQTLKSILGRENDVKKLKNELNLYHKIIIHGQHGMGKTTFIKYCLSLWNLQDFCYISYKEDLRTTLEEVRYSKNFNEKHLQEFENSVKKTSQNSLLIIDHMYNSKDLKQDLEELAKLPINVIAISINTVPQNSFHEFKISTLSDGLLKEIFKTYSSFSFNDDSLWNKLFFATQKNILLISVIANQCRKIYFKSQKKLSAPVETILESILSRLTALERPEKGKSPSPFSSYKYKHIYDSKTLDIIGHTKSIYNIILDSSNKSSREFIENLCLFGFEPIPYTFLSTILSSYHEDKLNELSKMGLLVLLDESVQLIPLICHSIMFEARPSSENYEPIVNNLTIFLKNYDETLSVPYLSDILYTFIQFLYPYVKRTNNPSQKRASCIFEKWQELLYLTVYYYHQCGNFHLAEKIISMIQYPDLTSFYSSLDQLSLLFENSIHSKYDPENIFKKLGDLLPKKIYNIKHLNFFLSCISQCNYMIGFYCHLQIHNMAGNKNALKALDKLPMLMSYHLYCPYSYMQQVFTLLSEEQTNYFKTSYKLMNGFPFTNTYLYNDLYFSHTFSYFEKFTEMNLRISGMAFTIFMHSLFVFNKPYYNHDSRNNQLLHSFITYIAPEIKTLQNQLNSCKLIPKETFRLCIFSHTIVAFIQRLCHSFVKESYKSSIAEMYNIGDLKKLLDYIFLSEDEKNAVLKMIDYFIL